MAENESLDLDDPYGRQWDIVFQSIRKNEPFDKVVRRVRRAMYRGLGKALKQSAEYGIKLKMLLDNRNSPVALRQFARTTLGHEYVQLFAQVASASSHLDTEGLLRAFVRAIWDVAGDRIAHKVVTRDGPTSFDGMRGYLAQVAEQVERDVDRIARKLAEDPSWKPKVPPGTNSDAAGDRIACRIVTSDGPTSFNRIRDRVARVAEEMEPGVGRTAREPADRPSWKPRTPAGTIDRQADSIPGRTMLQLETIDPRTLGQRLAEARKARGITQEDVASYLGCSRPTYIAVEKGERPAKAEEIVKLAAYFGRRVSELVRPGEPVVDFQPHLRAVAEKMRPEDEHELVAAIGDLQRLAGDYRELEQLMNAPLRYNYPPPVSLDTPLDVTALAESVASQERRRLGLGEQPVEELRRLLEWEVGLRIFYWPLPSAIAGMYAYADGLGCSIMVNRKHPAERRRASMLHEYGHLIVDRYKPGIDYLSMPGRKPANERFAEAFALSFLMPANAVRQRLHEIVAATNDFQVADLCRLSHFFFTSVEAMAIRLEQLGLIPKGSWALIKESKFAPRQAAVLLGLPARHETPDYYPERYKYLAVQAFEQEKISEEQLAQFLRCDPVTARGIVMDCLTRQVMEGDGSQRPVHLEFQRSLLSQP